MLLRHRPVGPPHHPRDLKVEVHDPDATVADLSVALEPHRPPGPLAVGLRTVAAATPLDKAAIPDGAVVGRPDPHLGAAPPVATIVVTAGFDTGRRVPLAPGVHVLGRSRGVSGDGEADAGAGVGRIDVEDPTVSGVHLRLHVATDGVVTVTDLGSTNGTLLGDRRLTARRPVTWEHGGTLACGAARLDLASPPTDRSGHTRPTSTADRGGTRPLHRRNRPDGSPSVDPVEIPPEPDAPPPVSPVGVVAVLGSMAIGVVMVVVLGSLTYALFALLGPVLMVANALDSKRRRRRSTRRSDRRRRAQLEQLARDLDDAAHDADLTRRARFAGPVDAVDLALHRPDRLWERRAEHHDAYSVRIGTGEVPWQPPTSADPSTWEPDVAATVAAAGLGATAVGLTLRPGEPVAVVGPAQAARSLVRSIVVQAAVHHGPADLQVAVVAAPRSREAWDWCGWLPHGRDPGAGSLLAGDPASAERVAIELAAAHGGPLRLTVIDDPDGLEARRGPARWVLRHATGETRLVPVVVVPDLRSVPASVTTVIEVSDDGTSRAPHHVAAGPVALLGTGEATARDVARILARFDDPEVDDPGRGLPRQVGLADLVGAERLVGPVVAARWTAAGSDPAPRALLGLAVDGPMEVDLAADGPHALVAGTTGSGKSELLRTLVSSLALGCSPDHLSFVLIDFKGGGAFDACARLPHVIGVVTDLDDHLAARALRCLDAELQHRERVLRRVGADDLSSYRRLAVDGAPLPRLVVVIDEFATLAAELPDFVDSLVGVAQRGRSLGVNLVLATQRPAGAVSDKIRANTALRVALRVQDRADSSDVIDAPDAAELSRQCPGRALVRFGPGELVVTQTALATARTDVARAPVTVSPIGLTVDGLPTAAGGEQVGRTAARNHPGGDDTPLAPTDLERLVAATHEAWQRLGGSPPRAVWPDPLPDDLSWPLPNRVTDVDDPTPGPELVLGLADDPDHQRRRPFVWRPASGPMLIAGAAGSGTSTALATAVLALSSTWSPAEAHVHVIDMGAGALTPLGELPAVGQVVGADDGERQRRLIQELAGELTSRRSGDRERTGCPRRFLVVDGIGALRDRWDPLEPSGTWNRFLEIATRGAPFGIHVLIAAEGAGAASPVLLSACGQRLVLHLDDRADAGAFGIAPAAVPPPRPGRGISATDSLVVQVARPGVGLIEAVCALVREGTPVAAELLPRRVDVLPERVTLTDLVERCTPLAEVDVDGTLSIAVGVAEDRLSSTRLVLPPGAHVLIAGPPRSGRSSTLETIGRCLVSAGVEVVRVAPGGEVSPADLRRLDGPGPVVVMVDDVDRTSDDDPLLGRLAAERRGDRHLILAGRSDRLRSRYAHWTREVRVDRCGLLLAPDPDLDGELLGSRIPRTWPVAPRPGLGWAVGAEPEGIVQVALPEAPQTACVW